MPRRARARQDPGAFQRGSQDMLMAATAPTLAVRVVRFVPDPGGVSCRRARARQRPGAARSASKAFSGRQRAARVGPLRPGITCCRRARARQRPGAAPSASGERCAWPPSSISRASAAASAPTTSRWPQRAPWQGQSPLLMTQRTQVWLRSQGPAEHGACSCAQCADSVRPSQPSGTCRQHTATPAAAAASTCSASVCLASIGPAGCGLPAFPCRCVGACVPRRAPPDPTSKTEHKRPTARQAAQS